MNRKERRALGQPAADRHRAAVQNAYALFMQGNLTGAEALLRQILAQAPTHPDAMRLLGEVLIERGGFAEAVALLRRLVASHARNPQAHYTLGNALRLSGQIDASITAYRRSMSLDRGFAGTHYGLAKALHRAAREHDALPYFREAVRLQPDWATGWRDLGLTLAFTGDLAEAATALQRAVTLQPSMGDAQRHLAAIRQDLPSANEISVLTASAQDARTAPAERIDMLFALARLADQAGQFDTAFGHFEAANNALRAQLRTAGKVFDRAKLAADIDRIIAATPPDIFKSQPGIGNPSEAPVFIVGMPRAGSSLFEQIAASHPMVFGAGERRDIGAIANRIGWAPSLHWTAAAIAQAASDYINALSDAANAARVIDKMPDNIFQLGLIAALFPNARIIFCERDARDVGLSCYFQHFAEPYAFDTNLADIAFRIRQLEKLRTHWLRVLPLRCMVLSYEALLQDFESETRRLIAFLGLDWDEKCLAFHQTERVVRTASWAQVRKPLYQDSAGRWKNYAPHLRDLFDTPQTG